MAGKNTYLPATVVNKIKEVLDYRSRKIQRNELKMKEDSSFLVTATLEIAHDGQILDAFFCQRLGEG